MTITLEERAPRPVLRTADVYQTDPREDVMSYSDRLLSVVADFRNGGIPEGCNARSMVGKSKTSNEVALRLYATVERDAEGQSRFGAVGFRARGCLAVTACGSMVAQMLEGRTFAQARQLTSGQLREALDGVPADKAYTLDYAICAVHGVMADYLAGFEGVSLCEAEADYCAGACGACLPAPHCSLRDRRLDERVAAMKR